MIEGRHRLDDIPPVLRWVLVSIKEVGFPVAVAVYMGYMQINMIPKMAQALEANTKTMQTIADNMDRQARISERAFRRILGNRYPD